MLDSQWLKRLHYLSRVAAPQKRGPGGGEVTGLRDYAPGDDYRCVDWIRCARHDDLLTRTFQPPDDPHVYVLLDCSPSMGLGGPAKFDLARQIAAALGYVALEGLARLSVMAFCDGIVAELPPIRHKAHTPRLLGFLRSLSLQGKRTDLKRTAKRLIRRYQRHGPAVVISDLYDHRGFQPGLDVLRHRGYEPRVVQVYGPGEARPDLLGELELIDVETGTMRRATITERILRRYQAIFVEFQESVRGYCAEHGLACVQVASDEPEEDVLLKVVGARGRTR